MITHHSTVLAMRRLTCEFGMGSRASACSLVESGMVVESVCELSVRVRYCANIDIWMK